jgi:hypothetical protein
MKRLFAAGLFWAALLACAMPRADDAPSPAGPAAGGFGIPDSADTRIGALRFFDGFPDSATIKAAYDYLDFMRGVLVALDAAPAVAQSVRRDALRRIGAVNGTFAIQEAGAEPAVALSSWLDLRKGALVVDVPADAGVSLHDAWARAVTLGEAQDPAAKVLVVPPGYKGRIPGGHRVAMPRTFGVLLAVQPAAIDADRAALDALRAAVRVYPPALASKPPRGRFVTLSASRPAPAQASALKSFEVVDRLVQDEPAAALDAEMAAMLAGIGVRKGARFRPDGRMQSLLAEAALVADGTARTLRVASREGAVEAPADSARVEPRSQGPTENLESRIGKLTFEGATPSPDTARLVYDHLDFMHGVKAFLTGLGAAATVAWQSGLAEHGVGNGTLGIFESGMDSRTLVITGDGEGIYVVGSVDLSAGPAVVESPPDMQGEIRTAWSDRLADLGVTGPDKGKGGRYLLLPPGYAGEVPKGFRVLRSPTFDILVWWRGMRLRGDPEPAIDNARRNARVYLLSEPRPVEGSFVNLSGRDANLLPAVDARLFGHVARVVDREPAESIDPATSKAFASIGIARGQRFSPDDRLQAILEESALAGDAIARSIVFATRHAEAFPWPRSQWQSGEVAFPGPGALEARVRSAYYVDGFAGAMARRGEAGGMQSAFVVRDAKGDALDGGKSYRLRLPAKIPAGRGWTLVPYDNQTRAMLQTDERFPGIGSRRPGLQRNGDGSIDVWFGPQAPAGKASNWVETRPDKGWTLVLRLFGPTDAWYAKAWRPGEVEPLK